MDSRARTVPRVIPVALAALSAGVVAHALYGAGVLGGSDVVVANWLLTLLICGAAAVCLARGVVISHERFAWLCLGAYLGLGAVGDLWWRFHSDNLESVPYPNVADAIYLGSYPFAYAGLLWLLRSRLRPFAPRCGSTARSAG